MVINVIKKVIGNIINDNIKYFHILSLSIFFVNKKVIKILMISFMI